MGKILLNFFNKERKGLRKELIDESFERFLRVLEFYQPTCGVHSWASLFLVFFDTWVQYAMAYDFYM